MASVMVGQDEVGITTLITTKFHKAGDAVRIIHDDALCLQVFRQKCREVVVLDGMMPHMDGFHICEQIRAHYDASSSPYIVLLSACCQSRDRQRGVDVGCDVYVTKPFKPADLLDHVTESLVQRGMT